MKKMLEAGVHFGHRSRFWHPKMAPYIFGVRNKVHIINLEKTLPMFNDALNYAGKVVAKGGNVLFVGTKRSATNAIKEQAIRCGMPYVNHRWLGGMLTNYKTIKASIKRLQDLEFLSEEGFKSFGKKESLMMTREMEKLERSLGGIKDMKGMPSAIFIVDIGYEKNAVAEARKLHIPVIGIVDSNHCPDNIDYIVPGNDDSIRSIEFYATEMANIILDSKKAAQTPATKPKKVIVADKKPIAKESTEKKVVEKKETVKKETTKKAVKEKETVKKSTTKKVVKEKETVKTETEVKGEAK